MLFVDDIVSKENLVSIWFKISKTKKEYAQRRGKIGEDVHKITVKKKTNIIAFIKLGEKKKKT